MRIKMREGINKILIKEEKERTYYSNGNRSFLMLTQQRQRSREQGSLKYIFYINRIVTVKKEGRRRQEHGTASMEVGEETTPQ